MAVKQFLTEDQCERWKNAATRVIDRWEPEEDYSWLFSSTEEARDSREKQLLGSAENLTFFIEADAVDPLTGWALRDQKS